MSTISYSTPLAGLDAVVLDTETTGLDARSARLVQIGAVRLEGARMSAGERLDLLVNPGVPIPPETTKVHGISDDRVRTAPRFAEIAPRFADYLGGSIVIGHTIAYDLEIIAREHELAGLAWRQPRALDVRTLARIASPSLAHYSLDRLCDWLGVRVEGRHTALGDAIATAEVYLKLLPLLRERNVRTIAEAEVASRELAERESEAASGLPALRGATTADGARTLARIDSYPYRHRVRDVMSSPAVFAPGDMTVRAALATLVERKISSVYIDAGNKRTGIVTERDLLREIHRRGPAGLDTPIGSIMSTPLYSIRDDAFIYRAIGRMDRLSLRHLAVRNEQGEIVGAITNRNLLRQRASSAIALGDEFDSAETPAALGRAWGKLAMMARSLMAEEVDPRMVAQVISSELRVVTRRAAELAAAEMVAKGRGPAPVSWAVMVLGSGGRGESLLAADQDNAIVYAEGGEGSPADRWLAEMAERMNGILDEVGVPLCKGGVMARNRQWRMSLADWMATVDRWIGRQKPEDLLNVDIFFDAAVVHGDAGLVERLMSHAFARAQASRDFLTMLSLLAGKRAPAFTLFGGLKLDERGRIDLKRAGLMPIFTSARVLALRHGIRERATPERIAALIARGIGSESELQEVIAAHRTLLGAMLGQQLADIEAGRPPSANVQPAALGRDAKADIAAALRKIDPIIDLVGEGRIG